MDYYKIYEEEHLKKGLSYSLIREKYNISRGVWDYYIRRKLNKNADRRIYRCIDDFFDIIDSEIKAYLLGVLYADGYISSDGRIGILLNSKDRELIEFILKYIAPNSPILELNCQNFKRDPLIKIRFRSKLIYKRLLELGFTTDKTHTNCSILTYIPEKYKRHFIRGYSDGDGNIRCLLMPNVNWCKISITFCNGVPKILEEILNYFSELSGKLRHKDNFYTLNYETQKDVYSICKILYLDSHFYLNRKYKSAINIIKYCNNTVLNKEIKESLSV